MASEARPRQTEWLCGEGGCLRNSLPGRAAAVLGSHAHLAPAPGSEGPVSLLQPPLPSQLPGHLFLAAYSLWTSFLFSAGLHYCSSRKSSRDLQSTVLPPSDAFQEVPLYPCLFGFHQSSLLERQEVWSASWGSAPYRFLPLRG